MVVAVFGMGQQLIFFNKKILVDKGVARNFCLRGHRKTIILICNLSIRDILDILVQYNRPKSTPTWTNSLGFSRLYIFMLEFIVTKVIVLYFYIIKI